jgi:transposase
MSRKEVPRAGLLKAALAGKITNAEGAGALHLSVRQFIRVKQRFQADGAPGLCHQLRGRPSPRRLPAAVRAQVATLLQTTYCDVNDCHATEKLREVEGVLVSRAAVRRIRRALDLPAKHRRRPRQHRIRRIPEPRMGALVQLDGSPHAWLEGRGPAMTLHGAIDDATRTVLALHFRPTEDLHGYTTLLQQIGSAYGLPLTLYGDRCGVLVRTDAHWTLEEELQGYQHPTHFGQLLRALAIGFQPAGSPQAKGRIERLWRTLQDRLVVELRLRGITTREAANAFLPAFRADYNRRFTHPPTDAHAAWRPRPRDFADQLSCRYTRTVAPDNTVRLGARWVQIPPGPHRRSYAGTRVDLRECVDGRLLVFHAGQRLVSQPTPGPDFVLTPRSQPHAERTRRPRASRSASEEGGRHLGIPPKPPSRPSARRPTPTAPAARPAATHPWRRSFNFHRRTPHAGVTFSRNS